jgi:hypothetical protein
MLRLDGLQMPEFGPNRRFGAADEAWAALVALREAGFISMDPIRPRPGQAAFECEPVVRLIDGRAEDARVMLGLSFETDPWIREWRAACRAAPWLSEQLAEAMATRRHRILERGPLEVLEGWQRIATERFEGLSLREVSARVFWALSKELDDRAELVGQLRAHHGLPPIPEMPLIVPVLLPFGWRDRGVLFVENQSTYAACVAGRIAPAHGLAIIYSSGYRSAARRLRDEGMALVHFHPSSAHDEEPHFLNWLRTSGAAPPAWFWGDLDYAGMGILRDLRSAFAGLGGWAPGYDPLLQLLRDGKGHEPSEAEKQKQVDPGHTDCPYADSVLLPALRLHCRFCDQEAITSFS